MNRYEILLYAIILLGVVSKFLIEFLNLKNISTILPTEFHGWYDEAKYKVSQNYLTETTRFGLVTTAITTPILVVFIYFGGFNFLDHMARSYTNNTIVAGLIFSAL